MHKNKSAMEWLKDYQHGIAGFLLCIVKSSCNYNQQTGFFGYFQELPGSPVHINGKPPFDLFQSDNLSFSGTDSVSSCLQKSEIVIGLFSASAEFHAFIALFKRWLVVNLPCIHLQPRDMNEGVWRQGAIP